MLWQRRAHVRVNNNVVIDVAVGESDHSVAVIAAAIDSDPSTLQRDSTAQLCYQLCVDVFSMGAMEEMSGKAEACSRNVEHHWLGSHGCCSQ